MILSTTQKFNLQKQKLVFYTIHTEKEWLITNNKTVFYPLPFKEYNNWAVTANTKTWTAFTTQMIHPQSKDNPQ
jgi:hypothetical protein